jgi:hypothetical protein
MTREGRHSTKQWVEAVLYGIGDQRRYTHDSPVLLDVWAQYFEKRGERLPLLLQPWLDASPTEVAESLELRMGPELFLGCAISYNRRMLAADLSLHQLVAHIMPLTGWYRDIAKKEPAPPAPSEGGSLEGVPPPSPQAIPLPPAEHIWDDLNGADQSRSFGGGASGKAYPYRRLLSFIRMAGIIFSLDGPGDAGRLTAKLDRLAAAGGQRQVEDAKAGLTEIMLDGWRRHFDGYLPRMADRELIHSISRNRPAHLATYQSVRTVKADAALSLFTIDCSALTWAVMDSGIDATHPAFRKDPDEQLPASAPLQDLLARSRVVETYDFSYLRELLLDPENPNLPPHVRRPVDRSGLTIKEQQDRTMMRRELLRRIRRSRAIDWDLVGQFVRVDHGKEYPRPADTHGTHVAGILAGNWREAPDEPKRMLGMCPNIKLIDIRVCRQDGTSDEFVIMSALQFVRHLNSSRDKMVIHGVNMSLSLEHDAAVYACGRTPVCDEAERTVANGVVVVAAAGNHGYRRLLADGQRPFDQFCPVSITDPGNAEQVITVGSTHRLEPHNYGVSYFSSRGPTGDGRVKPDLVAPGEKIYAPALGGGAVRLDGTSMAAPHVSGAAAMLMARHVELIGEPARIKKILCETATDLGREPYFQGRGLVDVLRAIQSV